MLENLFNRNNLINSNPLEINRAGQMVNEGSISSFLRNSFNQDSINLMNPQAMGGIPATSIFSAVKSPAQQIMDTGRKYNIPYTGDINSYQTRVVKALIMHKAMEYGVPLNIALGVAGNESGWKMWSNIEKGTLVKCSNPGSTDWGAMQINDKAHSKAFPGVKQNLEENVEYGMKFLSGRINNTKGNLNLGFGEWDRAIASYNLGHSPSSRRDFEIARKYVSHVKTKSLQA